MVGCELARVTADGKGIMLEEDGTLLSILTGPPAHLAVCGVHKASFERMGR